MNKGYAEIPSAPVPRAGHHRPLHDLLLLVDVKQEGSARRTAGETRQELLHAPAAGDGLLRRGGFHHLLVHDGQLFQVVGAADVARRQLLFVHQLPVKWHGRVGVGDDYPQLLILKCAELGGRVPLAPLQRSQIPGQPRSVNGVQGRDDQAVHQKTPHVVTSSVTSAYSRTPPSTPPGGSSSSHPTTGKAAIRCDASVPAPQF